MLVLTIDTKTFTSTDMSINAISLYIRNHRKELDLGMVSITVWF